MPLVSAVMTDVLRVRLPFFGSMGIAATTVVIALQMVEPFWETPWWTHSPGLQARVDLVLADVGMPGMSGPQFMERLRVDFTHVPVLFMSGHAPEQMSTHGIDSSHDMVLQKPFTPSALAIAVRSALDLREGQSS